MSMKATASVGLDVHAAQTHAAVLDVESGEYARDVRAVRAAADLAADRGGACGEEGSRVRVGRPVVMPNTVVARMRRERAKGRGRLLDGRVSVCGDVA